MQDVKKEDAFPMLPPSPCIIVYRGMEEKEEADTVEVWAEKCVHMLRVKVSAGDR